MVCRRSPRWPPRRRASRRSLLAYRRRRGRGRRPARPPAGAPPRPPRPPASSGLAISAPPLRVRRRRRRFGGCCGGGAAAAGFGATTTGGGGARLVAGQRGLGRRGRVGRVGGGRGPGGACQRRRPGLGPRGRRRRAATLAAAARWSRRRAASPKASMRAARPLLSTASNLDWSLSQRAARQLGPLDALGAGGRKRGALSLYRVFSTPCQRVSRAAGRALRRSSPPWPQTVVSNLPRGPGTKLVNEGRLSDFVGLLGGSSSHLFEVGRVSSSGLAVALRCRGLPLKFREVFGGADVPHSIRRFSKPRGLLALEAAAVSPGAFLSCFLLALLLGRRRRLAVPALFFFVCLVCVSLIDVALLSRRVSARLDALLPSPTPSRSSYF